MDATSNSKGGLAAAGACGAEVRLGTAAVPINPPLGIGLAGYYHERGNEGVHGDILAKTTVLDDGQTRAVIMVCDLISMPEWIVAEPSRIDKLNALAMESR